MPLDAFQEIVETGRNAEPLDITQALTTADIIRYTVPAGGPFITGAPQSNTLVEGAEALLSPLAPIAANALTDPMTIADVLLFTEVSESELASGALRRVTITASDVAFADETYNIDYSVFEEQLFESEIYTVNDRTLTFGAPVVHSPRKTLIHRVFINANTADSTITFAPGTWKQIGTDEDAADITIPSGENRTLEFTTNKAGDDYVRVLGEGSATSLIQTPVNEFYVANGLANNAGSPHNLGSFVCNRTGVYRFLTTERTNNNQVWANVGTTAGGSNIWNGNNYRIDDGASNGHDITRLINLTAGTTYYVSGVGGGSTTGSVTVEIRWAATEPTFTPEPPLPTSMHITSVSGNQTGNGFTANGVYRSNNTGPLQNTGFGNWTWRVKATRIGDWIQHMYWNDTSNIAFRESFDGGATWTAWAA